MFVEVQVKGNPFVKIAPTTKHYFVIEKTEKRLHLVIRNRTTDVPYCDSFSVQEEWLIESPDPSTQPVIKSSAFRQSFKINWYKSTMMKSTIAKNANAEVETVFKEYINKMIT